MNHACKVLAATLAISLLQGCASPRVAAPNTSETPYPAHWLGMTAQQAPARWEHVAPHQAYLPDLAGKSAALGGHPSAFVHPGQTQEAGLSPGDRVRVWFPGSQWKNGFFDDKDDTFSGVYEVGMNGHLKLPYLNSLSVFGLKAHELEALIRANLEHQGFFRQGMAQVSVTVQEWAPVTVFVNGAVFNDGQVTIHTRQRELPSEQFNTQGETLALDRKLSAALRAAGGVRPDADISRIEVIRPGGTLTLDLRGLTLGFPAEDLTLMHGDFIRVPSLGVPQEALIAPSPITPPGLRVFISNLTTPASDNASSAISPHSTSLPYGSRLHTAVVSGNCAGGTAATNSARKVVLITRDPVRQQPVTIERDIEAVMREAYNPGINPYLMPEDSLVCYDSEITNLRDIARTIGDLLIPFPLFR